jgi:hypothetical protein
VLVLVEYAAEPVMSVDVEVVESGRVDDRIWPWAWWSGTVKGTVGPVPVEERFELAQCLQQVRVVPDQGAVQELVPAGLDPALRDRVRSRHADACGDDLAALAGEHNVEGLGELRVAVTDQVLDLAPAPASCRSITRFLASWVTHAPVGWAVAPRTLTRRVAWSMAAKT